MKLFSRSRLEERWIQNAGGTSLRARTWLRGDFPIPDHPSLAIIVYDRIFVNLNTIRQAPEAGFDQNRFSVGLNLANIEYGRGIPVTDREHAVGRTSQSVQPNNPSAIFMNL